jgi:Family of unknown function (DUF5706)
MAKTSGQPRDGMSDAHAGIPAGDTNGASAEADAAEVLWKVIGRFDLYIGSTNAKAALLIAFNTFVTGSIALKGQEVRALFGSHRVAYALAVLALLVAATASFVSMWLTFRVIRPYLDSPRSPTQYHSAIFFNHVAEHDQPDQYQAAVSALDDAGRVKDLAAQAHAIARGLKAKFATMRRAIDTILYVQIPALGLVILLLFGSMACDILAKAVAQ